MNQGFETKLAMVNMVLSQIVTTSTLAMNALGLTDAWPSFSLKGLENVIGVSVVHPTWQKTRPKELEDGHTGWVFREEDDPPLSTPTGYGSFPCTGVVPDNINNVRSVRELYELSSDSTGKYSVPVLWDTINIYNRQ